MRVSAAVLTLLLGISEAFVPPSHVLPTQQMAPATTALNLWNQNSDTSEFAMPTLPIQVVSLLSASVFLFAPLPPVALAVDKVSTKPVIEQVTGAPTEQRNLASAKANLEAASNKLAATQKALKQAQLDDEKAQKVVEAIENKVALFKKSLIAANDKLAAAKAKGATGDLIGALQARVGEL